MVRRAHPCVNEKRFSSGNEEKNIALLRDDLRSLPPPQKWRYLRNLRGGGEVWGDFAGREPAPKFGP
jgi:hypothetical protein